MSGSETDLIVYKQEEMAPQLEFAIKPLSEEASRWYHKSWRLRPGPNNEPYNNKQDSGVDIPCPVKTIIPGRTVVSVKLGVCVSAFNIYWNSPSNFNPIRIRSAYMLMPRSSISSRRKVYTDSDGEHIIDQRALMLINSIGLIDIGYTGEISAQLYNMGDDPIILEAGEAVVQVVGSTLNPAEYVKVDPNGDHDNFAFPKTIRGADGVGSTGKMGNAT